MLICLKFSWILELLGKNLEKFNKKFREILSRLDDPNSSYKQFLYIPFENMQSNFCVHNYNIGDLN